MSVSHRVVPGSTERVIAGFIQKNNEKSRLTVYSYCKTGALYTVATIPGYDAGGYHSMLRWLLIILFLSACLSTGATEAGAENTAPGLPYPEAPPFSVQSRIEKPGFFPCSRCHEEGDTDPEPRRLRTRHTREIHHGGGKMWCLSCHDIDNVAYLTTLGDRKFGLDQAYIVCGNCHPYRQKDWYFGGHGKRVSGWREERVILNCTHCHDPHAPAIPPRPPQPPPPVRAGLERQEHHPPVTKQVWERQ